MAAYRWGIKLKTTASDIAVLKFLKKQFPDMSFAELRAKIQSHEYIYLSDMEKYEAEGERQAAKLLQALDKAKIETELFEEWQDTPTSWQTKPMCREALYDSIRQSREIMREVLIDIERETTGVVSQEALSDIEEELSEWDV